MSAGSRRQVPAGLVLALVLGAPANAAAHRDVAVGSGPLFVGATAPRIERQRIVLTCRDEDAGPVCEFEAHYAVANRTTQELVARGVFLGRRARQLQISTDEPSTTAVLDLEAMLPLKTRARGLLCTNTLAVFFTAPPADECLMRSSVPPLPLWTGRAFALPLAPGQTRWLAATGTLAPGVVHHHPQPKPSAWTRHPLLGHQRERVYHLDYWLDSSLALLTTDDASPLSARPLYDIETEVEVRLPTAWAARVISPWRPQPDRPLDAQAWRMLDDGGWHVARERFSSKNLPTALSIEIRRVPSFWRLGGAFIGAGVTLTDVVEERIRVGYELKLGSSLSSNGGLASISVDTNWEQLAIVTPGLELTTPMLDPVPSLGLGVGLPIMLAPERAVGVRGSLGVHFYGMGVVASYDWFHSESAHSQWTLLGQLSL